MPFLNFYLKIKFCCLVVVCTSNSGACLRDSSKMIASAVIMGPWRTPSQIKVNQNENLVRPSLKNLSGFQKKHCILYVV